MATIAELMVKVGIDADDVESGMGKVADSLDDNFGKITAAGAVAGAALEGFARKQAPLTEQTKKLSAVTGMQEQEFRDLVVATSNVTRPIEDVLDLFELGTQQGLRSKEELEAYAAAWDTVGDATSENGPALAKAGVALGAFGIDALNTTDAFAAFGFVQQDTTLQVGDFLNLLGKVGPELEGMNMSVDDAAALVGILEKDFGLTGKALNREFGTAVRNADGDMDNLLDTLGVSPERFADMRMEVDAASEVIEKNADIFGDTFTPLQKLQHGVEELMFKYGSLGEAAGMAALPLMATGPISKVAAFGFRHIGGAAVKSAKGIKMAAIAMGRFGIAAAKATIRVIAATAAIIAKTAAMLAGKVVMAVVTAAQWLWNIAVSANPIGIIILAIIALIAIVILLVKNWDKVVAFFKKAWEVIKDMFSTAVTFIKNLIKKFITFHIEMWTGLWKLVKNVVKDAWNSIKDAFSNALTFVKNLVKGFISFYIGMWTWLWDTVKNAVKTAWNFIKVTFQNGRTTIVNLVNKVRSFIVDRWNKIVAFFKGLPRKISSSVRGMFDGFKEAFRSAINFIIHGWNNLSFTAPKVDLGFLGTWGGFTIGTPNLPYLARGGNIQRGGFATVGERGPEEVFLPRGAEVSPLSRRAESESMATLRLDVTGADEDMKRVIRKWIREGNLVTGAAR